MEGTMIFYLTLLICFCGVAIVDSGNAENEIRKDDGFEMDILENLKSIKAEMLSLRTHLSKLSRRSKLMYSILKEKDNTKQSSEGTDSSPSRLCPPNFNLERHAANGDIACYRLESERASWSKARRRCKTWHSRLVSIETEQEQTYLTNYFKDTKEFHHCDFWTDGTDQVKEGDWRWNTTNKPLSYTHWHTWEPNNGSGLEHCMWLDWYFHWSWNDSQCHRDQACYICEIDLTE